MIATLAVIAMASSCDKDKAEDRLQEDTEVKHIEFTPEFCVFKLSDTSECVVTASDTCEFDGVSWPRPTPDGTNVRNYTYEPLSNVSCNGNTYISVEQTSPTTFLVKYFPVEGVDEDFYMYFYATWSLMRSPEAGAIEIIVNESGKVPDENN